MRYRLPALAEPFYFLKFSCIEEMVSLGRGNPVNRGKWPPAGISRVRLPLSKSQSNRQSNVSYLVIYGATKADEDAFIFSDFMGSSVANSSVAANGHRRGGKIGRVG